MAITRQEKEQAVSKLQAELAELKLVVLTDYRGLSVSEISELRAKLRAEGMSYRVTKNTLLRIAAKDIPSLAQVDPATFTGPMALAISTEDEVAPARVIFQYAKEHKALEIVGALTGDGELLSVAQVKALATLPTRVQLLGQLVGTIAAPLSGLVGVVGANIRGIVTVLNAIKEAKE
ncbi:MAG TPA: 50S ribosomal protein L10 [Candidatus Polarisedimenticolaceae bacterium]|nr:50S ribosomal protein L10 [Candidatus Polarisedimenticolaceae bacterium]